ncbi:uncharacterized protein LOC127879062 isoform X2 [Dreissena polymorpha]|uniref:uncharacterized protein LOC127879062 isoform X2 n=1 Tax=Dreissena polymorpha TaxID=45954 RepID=UPI0022641E4A|nr:uncharacterized protein LOC127879062 isoform X2 [Dreissena polymorpha]
MKYGLMINILLGIFIFNLFLELKTIHGKFLGGTISWMVLQNKLRLTYRLAWEKGTGPCGPGCNISNVGKEVSYFSTEIASLKWVDGNGTILHDVSYVLTSVSRSDMNGWEQGEAIFKAGLPSTPMFVRLKHIPWILSSSSLANDNGMLEMVIITDLRSDKGTSNQSPYSSLPSFLGIAHNCTSVIEIPAEDPDGDKVRCRWAEQSECGGGCTNLPINSVWLDSGTCKVTVNTERYDVNGTYRLAVMLEDYVPYKVNVGSKQHSAGTAFSKTPWQMTLRVIRVACDNTLRPEFVFPTVKDNARAVYSIDMYRARTAVHISYYLTKLKINGSLDFMISGPSLMKYVYESDDLNRTDVMKLSVDWTPKPPDQKADFQFCVWGVDSIGLTSKPKCVLDIVFDTDNCNQVKCENNGTCRNIFDNPLESCVCDTGYVGKNCTQAIQCQDAPCLNNGTCFPSNGSFICACDREYTGVHCENRITACTSAPCQNGGTCLDQPGSFQCICPVNFTGHLCEISFTTTTKSTIVSSTNLSNITQTTTSSTCMSTLTSSQTITSSVSKPITTSQTVTLASSRPASTSQTTVTTISKPAATISVTTTSSSTNKTNLPTKPLTTSSALFMASLTSISATATTPALTLKPSSTILPEDSSDQHTPLFWGIIAVLCALAVVALIVAIVIVKKIVQVKPQDISASASTPVTHVSNVGLNF